MTKRGESYLPYLEGGWDSRCWRAWILRGGEQGRGSVSKEEHLPSLERLWVNCSPGSGNHALSKQEGTQGSLELPDISESLQSAISWLLGLCPLVDHSCSQNL